MVKLPREKSASNVLCSFNRLWFQSYFSCLLCPQIWLIQGNICDWSKLLELIHTSRNEHSCLENPMDGGACWAAVHGVTNSWTPLSDFSFTFHFYALEKEMATHSSVLAWRIPGESGGLPSVGSHRVKHYWSDLAAAAAAAGMIMWYDSG